MNMKKFSCLLLLAGLLLFPPNGTSCGPFFSETVFVYPNHPGQPLTWYAKGNLGVVLPGYVRAYLVVAYRYFAGNPLSPGEQRAALSYWGWRIGASEAAEKEPSEDWLSVRSRILNKEEWKPDIQANRRVGYEEYTNCLAGSFRTAALTLRDRAARYGTGSPAVREWIKGQDTVFFNCGDIHEIPDMVDDASPAWLKADRRYQIAAAYFYSQSFDRAAREFDQIAADPASPWHALAPYLAARAIIRKAMLANSDGPKTEWLRDAENRLQQIVKDPKQQSIHHAARQMLGFVAFRTRPQERNRELARLLAGPRPDPDFKQDLIDYTWSLDHFVADTPVEIPDPSYEPNYDRKVKEWKQHHYRELAPMRGTHDMTDWILTFQQTGEAGKAHAIERWRKQQSLPWLVAALSKIEAADPAAVDLLRAAEQVPASAPAYPTLSYHRVRLYMKASENDKARALLDQLLGSQGPKLTVSSRNIFLAQRMSLATSFEDFLARAPRPVAELDDGEDAGDGLPECNDNTCKEFLYGSGGRKGTELRFDRDAALALNLRLPLDMLARAATGTELPEPLRGELAVAAWTRAGMLNCHDIAAALIPEIEKSYPVMKDLLRTYTAANPDEKDQSALFVILHFPGMRPYVSSGVARRTRMEKIDSYRDNWWCADVGANIDAVNYVKGDFGNGGPNPVIPADAPPYPGFLSPDQAKTAGDEWRRLAASGSGDIYLTKKTLVWAREHPRDPRLAEALHYAVRSTRYGCFEDKKHSDLSHRAFKVLHERYPNSKWAKATPYWF
jgi:hypothetical protein